MPTTSSGETVYAAPATLEEYVQVDPNQFSISTSGSPSAWREFLESIQVRAKARIDEFCNRDFEDHPGDTITLNGGATGKKLLSLPTPVRAVSEVRVDGEVVDSDEYVVDLDEAHLVRLEPPQSDAVDLLAQEGRSLKTRRPEWETGYQNIDVDLDWGYQSPPNDIVHAELELVSNVMQGLAQRREGMTIEQDDVDVKVQLPKTMTSELRGLLSEHRERGRTAGVI